MPWKAIKRDCVQKTTGKKGTHAVVKKKRGGKTEQESCHDDEKSANSAIRARHANESRVYALTELELRNLIRKSIISEKKWTDFNAPKGETITLSTSDFDDNTPGVRDLDEEIFDLIKNAYSNVSLGNDEFGHAKVRSPESLPAGYTVMQAADLDADPDPDYFRGSKMKSGRVKLGIVGHDGSDIAIQKYLDETAKQLKSGGMAEMSGAIAHVMITRHGVSAVTDQAAVESLLGKKVEWVGQHPDEKYASRYGPAYEGWYNRSIGGGKHMKILLGAV